MIFVFVVRKPEGENEPRFNRAFFRTAFTEFDEFDRKEQVTAFSVKYALYALRTGQKEIIETAKKQLGVGS